MIYPVTSSLWKYGESMEDYESIGHIMKHEEIDFLWFGNAKENPCDMFQTKNSVTVEDSN